MKASPFRFAVVAFHCLVLLMLLGLPASAKSKTSKIKDLADTIAANPILTQFAAVIAASDLGTFLSSRGPFTVFVPTDSAFSKLPPGMLDTLLRPENKERLQDILLFHVVNGKRLTAKDLLALKTVLSCQGNPLTIRTSKSRAQFILKAKIVHADIHCLNGIINEIDTLLMPPEASLPPIAPPPPPPPPTPVAATNAPTVTPIDSSNAPPPMTNAPPEDTNATPLMTNAPAEQTNAPPTATNAPGVMTNTPSVETNVAPMTATPH